MVNFIVKLVNGDVLKFPAQNVIPSTRNEAIANLIVHLTQVPALHSENHPAIMADKILSIDIDFGKPELVVDNTKINNIIPIKAVKGQLSLNFDPTPIQLSLI